MLRKISAQLWNWFYRSQYRISILRVRHGGIVMPAILMLLITSNLMSSSYLQTFIENNLSSLLQNNISNLRALFLSLGSALIGASAIAFSLVVFAMQVNVERMPHGLFRRFSTDKRIITAFIGTFTISIFIAGLSLVPDNSWVAIAVIGAVWGVILIFISFLYAYRRALILINPLQQLNIIVRDADEDMQRWVKRTIRITPLLKGVDPEASVDGSAARITHDLARITYFGLNPQWSAQAQRAILHSMSFARRYSEQGDHEISAAALKSVISLNKHYVNAKGKTFFSQTFMVDNPLTSDGFINNTLELVRQYLRTGLNRGDEQQIEQALQAMAMLAGVYVEIDYAAEAASKTHAHIAANYLSEGVKAVLPHDMPDVLMEGVRLMGKSAQLFIARDKPSSCITLAENIALLACTGCANEKYRPITLVAMEQLANLTFNIIRTDARNIHYEIEQLRDGISTVVKMFLKVPDAPLQNIHSTFLAPYYSCTTSQALLSKLRELINALSEAAPEDVLANTIIRNIEMWADGLYQSQKELLLLAIEKRSGFTFDIIHWIASITEMLLALSNAHACDGHTQDELRKHALWLIYVIDHIPGDEETIKFVENYQPLEILFEASLDANNRDCQNVSIEIRKIIINWAFKGGIYQTGWATFERSIYALTTLVLTVGNQQEVDGLKQLLANRLSQSTALSQEIRDRAAREIRQTAATLYRKGFETRAIEYHMNRLDQDALQQTLVQMADIISPETANEPIRSSF